MKKSKLFSAFIAFVVAAVCLTPGSASARSFTLNGGTLNSDGIREFQYGSTISFSVSGYTPNDWIGIYYAHDFEFLERHACRAAETINTWSYVDSAVMTVGADWKPASLYESRYGQISAIDGAGNLSVGSYVAVYMTTSGGSDYYEPFDVDGRIYFDIVPDGPFLSLSKSVFAPGERIDLQYGGISKNNTWVAIYSDDAGFAPGSQYQERSATQPSLQYVYIGGEAASETIPFNQLDLAEVSGYTRDITGNDTAFSETKTIFYRDDNQNGTDDSIVLPAGNYHAVVLGGASFYDVIPTTGYIGGSAIPQSNYIPFCVEDTGITVEIDEPQFTVNLIGDTYADGDWVAIYRRGETPGSNGCTSLLWWYINNDTKHITWPEDSQIANESVWTVLPGSGASNGVTGYNGNTEPNRADSYFLAENGTLKPGNYSAAVLDENYNVKQGYSVFDFTISPSENSSVQPSNVSYQLENSYPGWADGTITVTASDSSYISGFSLFWGTGTGPLPGYSDPFGMALKTAEGTYAYEVPEGLVIPQGATHLWVYNNDNAEKCAAITIPAHDAMPSVSNPLYTFSVLSDIHVAADKTIQCANLSSALSYIKNNTQSSAVITVGDNVDNGTESAWSVFNTIRNQYISSSLPMYCAIGNHEWKDANGVSSSTAALDSEYTARFKNNAVAGASGAAAPDHVYYSFQRNGCKFILLGSEGQASLPSGTAREHAYLSQTQISWFQNEVNAAKAADPDQPIFVFLHQPLKNTVSGSLEASNPVIQDWWGVSGDTAEAQLRSVIESNTNVLLFTGHTHWEFHSRSPILLDGDKASGYINTASVGYLWNDNNLDEYSVDGSQGYIVELHDGFIYLRGRDFAKNTWNQGTQYLLPIRTAVSGGAD